MSDKVLISRPQVLRFCMREESGVIDSSGIFSTSEFDELSRSGRLKGRIAWDGGSGSDAMSKRVVDETIIWYVSQRAPSFLAKRGRILPIQSATEKFGELLASRDG